MLAGVNADTRTIPDGCPVGWQTGRKELDRVVLAGGGVAATGVAYSGATPRGVVNFYEEGTISLADWTPVTDTPSLTEGAIYRLGDPGKLTTAAGGQVIGVAASTTALKLAIDRTGAVSAISGSYATSAELAALTALVTAHINNLTMHAGLADTRSWPLTADQSVGAVSGLALSFIPTHINICGVLKPVDGLNIQAYVVDGTITADGFSYTLDGEPGAGYTLVYQIIP